MPSSGELEKLERRWAENQLGLTFAPLAEAYRKAGEPARALELLQIGMAQHPNYIPAHIVKGRCYLDGQSDSEAELSFLRVTELDPENVIALKSLAEISERAGRLPEAMRRLQMLLEVDRNNEEARGQLDRVREVHASLASLPAGSVEPEPVPFAPEPEPLPELEPAPPVAAAPAPAAAVAPPPVNEFQLRNDAETLLPSDDRLDDVLLAEETELTVRDEPAAPGGGASGFVLSVGDFSSEMLYEPPAPGDESAPPAPAAPSPDGAAEPDAVQEPEVVPEPEPEFEPAAMGEPAPPAMGEPVPIVDVQPPPPPADDSYESYLPPSPPAAAEPSETPAAPAVPEPIHSWEQPQEPADEPVDEPVAEPVAALEPEDAEAPAPAEPELVVTETMAEIFLRQGHRELALAVYAQLAQRDPWNSRVAEAAAALQQELAPPAPPPPPEEPAPRFAASETGGTSVHYLFSRLLAASRPAVATAIHPPAFEAPRRPGGEPTRPAADALSLSAVFGDEAAPAGPASPPPEAAAREPSFDEFFAPGASADAELPRPPGQEASAAASQAPEDLEQFNAWLRGLKR